MSYQMIHSIKNHKKRCCSIHFKDGYNVTVLCHNLNMKKGEPHSTNKRCFTPKEFYVFPLVFVVLQVCNKIPMIYAICHTQIQDFFGSQAQDLKLLSLQSTNNLIRFAVNILLFRYISLTHQEREDLCCNYVTRFTLDYQLTSSYLVTTNS